MLTNLNGGSVAPRRENHARLSKYTSLCQPSYSSWFWPHSLCGRSRQLRSALNNEIARLSVADVISSARETLVKQVMKVMSVELEKIGVTIVDVRLKRVDFAPEVAERVYEWMRSERTRVANERRAKGAAEGKRRFA